VLTLKCKRPNGDIDSEEKGNRLLHLRGKKREGKTNGRPSPRSRDYNWEEEAERKEGFNLSHSTEKPISFIFSIREEKKMRRCTSAHPEITAKKEQRPAVSREQEGKFLPFTSLSEKKEGGKKKRNKALLARIVQGNRKKVNGWRSLGYWQGQGRT